MNTFLIVLIASAPFMIVGLLYFMCFCVRCHWQNNICGFTFGGGKKNKNPISSSICNIVNSNMYV